MNNHKSTFALLFGNRGFFPAHYMESARKEPAAALQKLGHEVMMMSTDHTRLGAVATPAEGRAFAGRPSEAVVVGRVSERSVLAP
ncbi:MAG: hypothetical protein ACOCYC_01265 [bacterium]